MSELDSDMADITQEHPAESILGDEDGERTSFDENKLRSETPTEHEPVSASSQMASSMGINPHTLQVVFVCVILSLIAKKKVTFLSLMKC